VRPGQCQRPKSVRRPGTNAFTQAVTAKGDELDPESTHAQSLSDGDLGRMAIWPGNPNRAQPTGHGWIALSGSPNLRYLGAPEDRAET
jgi:hypothetical protein